ncbi:MAG: Fic family protein [Candidatus Dormiibacterota bacterium]
MNTWPELVVSTTDTSRRISREVAAGRLRRLAQRFYTSNLTDPLEAVVRRHYLEIAGAAFPGAVISDRSAASPNFIAAGSLFLALPKEARDLSLPDLVVRPRLGSAALASDVSLGNANLYLAGDARLLLENLHPSRGVSAIRRRLTPVEVEEFLDTRMRTRGREALESLADAIPGVARELNLVGDAERAVRVTREFLGTHQAAAAGPLVVARRAGRPYDPTRLALLEPLVATLLDRPPVPMPVRGGSQVELPFFEAYFSNYIEGTQFAVEEARAIVESGRVSSARPADAHDILGVFGVVANEAEMRRVPQNYQELRTLLVERHRAILVGRPEKRPGELKLLGNRAGATTFVAPDLVEGTLYEGFNLARPLIDPFGRAVFMALLIAEVHPFDDGNGRIARIFMNGELAASSEQRIIITTAMRDSYVSGLRGFSHSGVPKAIVAVMDWAQRYTRGVDWATYQIALNDLEQSHAFLEPRELDEQGVKLRLPGGSGLSMPSAVRGSFGREIDELSATLLAEAPELKRGQRPG